MGARNHNPMTGLPANIVPFIAALTLAGNMEINNTIRQIPATERNLGSSNPTAPMKFQQASEIDQQQRPGKHRGNHPRQIVFHFVEVRDSGEDKHNH